MFRLLRLIFILIVFAAGMMVERYGNVRPIDRLLDRFVSSEPVTNVTRVFQDKVDQTIEDAKSQVRDIIED